MRLFFRLFLWLSITVLSLQGGAAMAVTQLDKTAHQTSVAAGCHHQASAHMVGEHCHKADQQHAGSSHAKCATCPACCGGAAAPPAPPPAFHSPSLVFSVHDMPEATMSSFVPATLDRPPRRSSV